MLIGKDAHSYYLYQDYARDSSHSKKGKKRNRRHINWKERKNSLFLFANNMIMFEKIVYKKLQNQ